MTPELCEIQVNIRFAENLEGSQWCEPCNIDSKSSHTCDEYQDVINEIFDDEHAIFCIVESRLLHSKPLEMKAHDFLQKKIDELKVELKERQELQKEWAIDMKERKKQLEDIKAEFEAVKTAKNEIIQWTKKGEGA